MFQRIEDDVIAHAHDPSKVREKIATRFGLKMPEYVNEEKIVRKRSSSISSISSLTPIVIDDDDLVDLYFTERNKAM